MKKENNKMKTATANSLIMLGFFALFASTSCKDKKQVSLPQPVLNQPELITTLILTLTDSAQVTAVSTASFRDLDGIGGNAPVITDTLRLKKDKVYFANVLLLDETKSPVDTVSKEILKEGADHQFFYTFGGLQVKFGYRDKDVNNMPIGLSTRWATQAEGTGTARIVLKHQVGVKNGTEAPGETDIEVLFNTKIKN